MPFTLPSRAITSPATPRGKYLGPGERLGGPSLLLLPSVGCWYTPDPTRVFPALPWLPLARVPQLKTDKAQEIKKLNQQIQMVHSDMSKHREALEDCLRCFPRRATAVYPCARVLACLLLPRRSGSRRRREVLRADLRAGTVHLGGSSTRVGWLLAISGRRPMSMSRGLRVPKTGQIIPIGRHRGRYQTVRLSTDAVEPTAGGTEGGGGVWAAVPRRTTRVTPPRFRRMCPAMALTPLPKVQGVPRQPGAPGVVRRAAQDQAGAAGRAQAGSDQATKEGLRGAAGPTPPMTLARRRRLPSKCRRPSSGFGGKRWVSREPHPRHATSTSHAYPRARSLFLWPLPPGSTHPIGEGGEAKSPGGVRGGGAAEGGGPGEAGHVARGSESSPVVWPRSGLGSPRTVPGDPGLLLECCGGPGPSSE